MPAQVCAVCGGDNPDCIACRGSGVDRPPSYYAIPSSSDRDIMRAVEGLTDRTSELVNVRIQILTDDLRHWLIELVWVAALMIAVVISLSYFLFTHDTASWVSVLLVVIATVAGALGLAVRIMTLSLSDPLLPPDEEEHRLLVVDEEKDVVG